MIDFAADVAGTLYYAHLKCVTNIRWMKTKNSKNCIKKDQIE